MTSAIFRGDYRTSDSWKDLLPKRNFNELSIQDESVDDCYQRLKGRFNIPKPVIQQWLYGLYYDENTVNNYGWINFDLINIKLVQLTLEDLLAVRVINNYRGHVEEGANFKAYEQLPCNAADKNHWKEFNTWRTPPIVLNVKSLAELQIPQHADLDGNLQLVEGHSRLGYLYAIANCGHRLKERHDVYMMTYNS